jgi:anti-sigma B factor antagonist
MLISIRAVHSSDEHSHTISNCSLGFPAARCSKRSFSSRNQASLAPFLSLRLVTGAVNEEGSWRRNASVLVQLLVKASSPAPFSARARSVGSSVVIEVAGEVDLATAPELERAIELNSNAAERVVIDLTDAAFVDSSALQVLVTSREWLAGQAIVMSVVVPTSSIVYRPFEIASLVETLNVLPKVEDALPTTPGSS